LKSHPENIRRHFRSAPRTPICTKAPVNGSASQGAVRSHAARRITTSPTRTDWPGFTVTSRLSPLRLLSRPSTATRSAIGVPPVTTGVSTVAIVSMPSASPLSSITCSTCAGAGAFRSE
jgi:hypothetical protein